MKQGTYNALYILVMVGFVTILYGLRETQRGFITDKYGRRPFLFVFMLIVYFILFGLDI